MDRLEWRLPTGMRVFHFGAPGPEYYPLDNPVVLHRPVHGIKLRIGIDLGITIPDALNVVLEDVIDH